MDFKIYEDKAEEIMNWIIRLKVSKNMDGDLLKLNKQNVSLYMLINLSITFILKILYLVIIDASGTVTENG